MPTTICDAAALVPATATSQAHVHQCNRQLAVGFPHLGQHHCGECGSGFIVTPASAPTATEKCEACGAIQPTTNLREMYPEPDVTQYVCLDTAACSARVAGRQQQHDMRWPLSSEIQECGATCGDVVSLPLVEPLAQHDPAQAEPALTGAIGIIRGLRDVVDDMPRGTAGRTTLQRHLAQLERQLIEYRPPTAELVEMQLEPGVVDQVNDLDKRVAEVERAVANLIERRPLVDQLGRCLSRVGDHQCTRPYGHGGLCTEGDDTTPPYVHRLLDAYLTGAPLDFRGEPVPLDVQRRLEDEPSWRRFTAVRTSDGRVYAPRDVELVYGP